MRLASLGEHGADPAELAGGEQQPAGAWHSVIRQVRVARAPRGRRGGSPHREWVPGGWPAASAVGHLQLCARGKRRRWRSPFCSSPGSGLGVWPAPHTHSQPGWPGAGGFLTDLTLGPADASPALCLLPGSVPPVPWMVTPGVPTAARKGSRGRSQGTRGEAVGRLAGGARVWAPGECTSSNEPKESTRLHRELPGKG